MAIANFRSKLNFEPKQIQFIDKVYTLKTDHKTGLLLQELFKKEPDASTDEKMLRLVFGEKQYNELMEELRQAGEENGAEKTRIFKKGAFAPCKSGAYRIE